MRGKQKSETDLFLAFVNIYIYTSINMLKISFFYRLNIYMNIFNKINIYKIKDLPDAFYYQLYDNLTPIEYCLKLYIEHTNELLLIKLKQIIYEIYKKKYIRPPYLYASYINLDKKDKQLYDLILIDNDEINISDFNDIHKIIINQYIEQDNKILFDYKQAINEKITIDEIETIIIKNKKNLYNSLINMNEYKYYVIIIKDDLNIIDNIDNEILLKYLELILEYGASKMFMYLYLYKKEIIYTKYENENNILFKIKEKGNYIELIKIICTLDNNIINQKNINGDTIILYNAKYNINMLMIYIKYEIEFNYEEINNKENNIFHQLAKNNNTKVLKIMIKKYKSIFDKVNNKNETPLIIMAKNKFDDMVYIGLLESDNLNQQDEYGNTIWHYICKNNLCLGININNNILNKENKSPKDLCVIDESYYHFGNC